MIRVLVVEDSPVLREFLAHILGSDPEIQVVGTAGDGEKALEATERFKPDVITMDINMPRMNGFEATRRIMEAQPTPIVIVSGSWDTREVQTTFRALEAGALTVLPRPMGIHHPEHEMSVQELVRTVKLMSEVKVVRRWSRARRERPVPSAPLRAEPGVKRREEIQIVVLGASTGGPQVLQTILSGLPADFPFPVLIVQHMAAGFIGGFVDWLSQTCAMPIHLPAKGEPIHPGHVYVAPDGFQMKVGRPGKILLTLDEPENGLRPSVSCLFRSVAEIYGQNAAGVLLTGMGRDGAEELKLLRDRGALTIAQTEESSVVFGMPGVAVSLGAADYVLPPEQIAAALAGLAEPGRKADLECHQKES